MHGLWFRNRAVEQIGTVSVESLPAKTKLITFSMMSNEHAKRYLLWLIIFNGVVFHTTMTVLSALS